MKLNCSLVLCACLFFYYGSIQAQNNVGIGVVTPDPSSILHLNSSTQGLLVPRMDSISRKNISAPTDGLMVFDTSVNCFYYYSTTTGATGWTSLCPGGSANPYNTSFNYDAETDSLTITDGGGTKGVNISPLREDVRLAIDLYDTQAFIGAPVWTPVKTMQLTFTPNKGMVYIIATACGNGDQSTQKEQAMSMRIRDLGANLTVVGAGALANASTGDSLSYGTGWNISMSTPYAVTPGVAVTIQLQWWFDTSDHSFAIGSCLAATQPDFYHCNMLVFE